ncbi:MAG TPA: ATP-grasp domain-containing protein [Bacillota bacterium]|nr:ATP-grasp domain-containing protein [Candidatus Fermentithermobacillaceae bacterium]HOK63728.1 ATP-grasp domain-containing protein [Bacillota bacterium]HOL12559.1 ATP-grasp domain-containing protein [Bacillota bacterium]HOQ02640.1 ATP-grasp domain-containing protein [Bacillota bacterium]HPP60276.1 ATP-grasp domain-containing protein [Bacillota bacterium]
MKKLLVLGSTYIQIPLITKGKEMGLYTISLGENGGICRQYADEWVCIDVGEVSKVLEFARDSGVSGVISCGSELGIYVAAYVNEQLGLSDKFVSSEAAKNAALKDRYTDLMSSLVPPGFSSDAVDQVLDMIGSLSGRIVFKPGVGGGGRGITVLDDRSDSSIREAFYRAQNASKNKKVVVQQFIEGKVIGVESFTFDWQVRPLAVPEKDVSDPPACITRGVIFPSRLSDEALQKVLTANEEAIKSMGIQWGPTHIDMVVDERGNPWVIDVGARLSSGLLMSVSVPDYYNYDFVRAAILLAMGEMPPEIPTENNGKYYASRAIIADKDGILKSVTYDEEAMERYNVLSVIQMIPTGAEVRTAKADADRIIKFVVREDSYEKALENLDRFERTVRVVIEKHGDGSPASF